MTAALGVRVATMDMTNLPGTRQVLTPLADPDAVAIGKLYRLGRQSMVESVRHLIEVGIRLKQKKDSLGHGEWLAWLEDNADVLGFETRRTASRLMKAAEHAKWVVNVPFDEVDAQRVNRIIWGNNSGLTTGVAMDPHDERGHDVYETPPEAVWPILTGCERFPGAIWEPACCRGNIVKVLRAAGYRVVATDLIDYGFPGAEVGVDFLKQTSAPAGVETIITNPPFMHADECVRHALTLVPRVVMLLRVLFIETTGRSDILDSGHLRRIHVFRERIDMHRDGWTGPRESSAMGLAWFDWDRNYNGPIITDRISCQGPPYDSIDNINKSVAGVAT
jgi:hypothetical protein